MLRCLAEYRHARGEDARLTKREMGESIRVYATNLPHGRLSSKQTLAVVRSLFMLMAYNMLQLARHQCHRVKWDGKVWMS